jgi:hypothetical protein
MWALFKLFNILEKNSQERRYLSGLIRTWEQEKMTMSLRQAPKTNLVLLNKILKKFFKFPRKITLKLLVSISISVPI